uniref:Uncharacterized protein n=1 Tax=Hippocampus comes TaxID=109280 RepID=A0A3Q2XE18_HIPCM
MLHQDQPLAYGGQNTNRSSSSVSSRKYDQDGNHNFLTGNGRGRGDENQNPHRPSKLGPLTPDLKSSPSNSGILSPRSRMPCWSTEPTRSKESSGKRRSFSRNSISGSHMEDLLEEGAEERHDQSSDSDGELPEMMDAVWTLRDRERFKAQEMEKHQVQLTMYRRLALIRWLRTLQGRVEEQQNRLQSSFDIILTHRKELVYSCRECDCRVRLLTTPRH